MSIAIVTQNGLHLTRNDTVRICANLPEGVRSWWRVVGVTPEAVTVARDNRQIIVEPSDVLTVVSTSDARAEGDPRGVPTNRYGIGAADLEPGMIARVAWRNERFVVGYVASPGQAGAPSDPYGSIHGPDAAKKTRVYPLTGIGYYSLWEISEIGFPQDPQQRAAATIAASLCLFVRGESGQIGYRPATAEERALYEAAVAYLEACDSTFSINVP